MLHVGLHVGATCPRPTHVAKKRNMLASFQQLLLNMLRFFGHFTEVMKSLLTQHCDKQLTGQRSRLVHDSSICPIFHLWPTDIRFF